MGQLTKADFLYEGKAKTIYNVKEDPQLIWMAFKDNLTAFNGEKKGSFSQKGKINAEIASLIFDKLSREGVKSHFVKCPEAGQIVAQKVEIIPLEVVVRNVLAGSTAKRLGFEEGTYLSAPLVEFYYKKDELGDPFISDDQALLLNAVHSREVLEQLKQQALNINNILLNVFSNAGIRLVDFKLEFGFDENGEMLLADEITPDSCRLWDLKTGKKMDKDRFRRDLGEIKENYQEILQRLRKVPE